MKRVAILYSGQMRANSLNPNFNKDDIILEATKKYLLNDAFKTKYEYDVFISTDNIDINKAIIFFGNNLKNINITETNWYLNPIDDKSINSFEFFKNKNINKVPKTTYLYDHFINSMYQYYRLYITYIMLEDYISKTNTKYDYIMRIRPDIQLLKNITTIFNILETSNLKIVTEHEQLCIFVSDLKDILKIIFYYGDYKNIEDIIYYKFLYSNDQVSINDYLIPERQFISHIFSIFKKNNYNINESFMGIKYPTYNALYKEDGSYGYMTNTLHLLK